MLNLLKNSGEIDSVAAKNIAKIGYFFDKLDAESHFFIIFAIENIQSIKYSFMSIIGNSRAYLLLNAFLEEELTELVKRKLIARDKYKELDPLINDYLLAENFGDEVGKKQYADEIDDFMSALIKKIEKQTSDISPLDADLLLIDLKKRLVACTQQRDLLPNIPDAIPQIANPEGESLFTDALLQLAEHVKGETLTKEERDLFVQKLADGTLWEESQNFYSRYYHYDCPDYSVLAKMSHLSKPITGLVTESDEEDFKIKDIIEGVSDWNRDKLVKNVNVLIYRHLAAWQDESDDVFQNGLRAALVLIEHYGLRECLPLVLEILRQDYEFQDTYFDTDALEDMQAAVLSNIVAAEDLPLLLDFMKEPGILFSTKKQVAMAVAHLPKRDASMLRPVQQWLADVLDYYMPLGTDTDMFDECLLDVLVYCCIHCNAADLKPLIIKLYTQYKIPYIMVGGGCNEMRQKIKKAPLGTLDEESAETMLIDSCEDSYFDDDEDEDWDDAMNDWDDEELPDPDFKLEDYGWQEFHPYAIKPKAVYKPIFNIRKFTLRISLNGTKPAIWREVEVPSNLTLSSLASVILLSMGWDEDHLHQFIKGKGRGATYYKTSVGDLDDEMSYGNDGRKYCVGELLQKMGDVVCFEYDYGDSWYHTVKLVASSAYDDNEKKEVVLTAGERACPPEDCGGIPGYMDICDSMKNPKSGHAQYLMEWMGFRFDPELFPLEMAKEIVKRCNK